MATSTTLLSLAEFQDLPDNGMRNELSEGELIEMPPPKHLHSQAAHAFLFRLYEAAKQYTQFSVRSEAAYLLSRNPPTVRASDVSVLRTERVAGTPADGYIPGAPELAIEVISPSDTAEDLMHKIQQYLEAGATTVWAAYPKDGTIQVYRRGEPALTLGPGDRLEEPTLLPGWSAQVSEFF